MSQAACEKTFKYSHTHRPGVGTATQAARRLPAPLRRRAEGLLRYIRRGWRGFDRRRRVALADSYAHVPTPRQQKVGAFA